MKINKKNVLLFLLVVFSANFLNAHPYYVSICKVDYNEQTKSLEIAVKTFADDLLLGLENAGKNKLYLGEVKENPNTDNYISEYLSEAIQFEVNDKKVNFLFVGKEIEKDVVWSYLEIEGVGDLKRIQVNCNLLTEVLEGQSNIIQVNKNGTIKNLLLSKNTTSGKLNFNN